MRKGRKPSVRWVVNGRPASVPSVKRDRRILNVAMQVTDRGKGRGPKTSSAIDKRSLISPDQVAALLGWMRERPWTGRTLHAF